MIIAYVQSEIIHSFKSFLKIQGIKYTESNGFFHINPDSEYLKKQLNKFFTTRRIKEEIKMVTNNE